MSAVVCIIKVENRDLIGKINKEKRDLWWGLICTNEEFVHHAQGVHLKADS